MDIAPLQREAEATTPQGHPQQATGAQEHAAPPPQPLPQPPPQPMPQPPPQPLPQPPPQPPPQPLPQPPPQPPPLPLPHPPPQPLPLPQPQPQPPPQPLHGLQAPPPMELENNEAALQNFLEDENLVVGINADDMGTNPPITLEGVCDSIVSSRTLQCYMGEIMKFLLWCVENKPNWLMADGTDCIAHIMEEHGGEGVCARRSHTHTEFFGLLCSCDESPVLLLGEVTPHGIMEYAMGCHHMQGRQGYLSKSVYGTICAVVFHLFRVHNHVEFSEIFHKEVGNLFHVFSDS